MTCVVGLKENNDVWVGADTSAVNDYLIFSTKLEKVFRKGEYVIGYTSSFRMGQLLQHVIELPKPPEIVDTRFMVLEIVEAIRKGFKEFGYSKIENNEETGGTFIIGVKNQLFQIYSDYQVNLSEDDFMACGSGDCYALAAMEALKNIPPVQRIQESIRIAGKFCPSVLPTGSVLKVMV